MQGDTPSAPDNSSQSRQFQREISLVAVASLPLCLAIATFTQISLTGALFRIAGLRESLQGFVYLSDTFRESRQFAWMWAWSNVATALMLGIALTPFRGEYRGRFAFILQKEFLTASAFFGLHLVVLCDNTCAKSVNCSWLTTLHGLGVVFISFGFGALHFLIAYHDHNNIGFKTWAPASRTDRYLVYTLIFTGSFFALFFLIDASADWVEEALNVRSSTDDNWRKALRTIAIILEWVLLIEFALMNMLAVPRVARLAASHHKKQS
jgi:hypothetical protein